ncbi:hypothetical protein CACET_c23830 [Clostridium aceticum]|uniref:Uncharacterized protein n=1 Tax=Clostridium aceticum TaxID=84022 RepID=A0A0D8I5D5_9CLOT|nr:hypothetical protein [Clostridium aceticum]AKL95829.1 hypothetical protein CACET_c23830 [Clostridium aceticum]KJF25448.1 hypothetical protein TZ02_18550 [Clostridium aceticum]
MLYFFKKKRYVLKFALGIIIMFFISGCQNFIPYLHNQKTKLETINNGIYNDSMFELEMLNHRGELLPSRHIVYDSSEEYTLVIRDTNTEIIGYKLMLLIDGLQYDLSEDDMESKAFLLSAENGEASTHIDFSRINTGYHFGMFIIEKIYESPRKFLTPEQDIRFTIYKSEGESSSNIVQPQLKVSNVDSTTLLASINRSIEFVAFPAQMQPPFEIRQNNEVSQDSLSTYNLYLYNSFPFKTDYWIGVISEGEVITNAYNSDYILSLAPYAETVVQVTLSNINITQDNPFYFVAIPNPQQECDSESLQLAWREGKSMFTLFSQKFIITDSTTKD